MRFNVVLLLCGASIYPSYAIQAQSLGATVSVGNLPGSIAVNQATNKIYVANSNSSDVTVIDGITNSTTTVPAGDQPLGIAVNPTTNKIYVANSFANTVTVIDGVNGSTAVVDVGALPQQIVVNPVTNKVYVSNDSSKFVTVIDGDTNTTVNVPLRASAKAIAVNSVSDKVYVGFCDSVTVIDGASNSTLNLSFGYNSCSYVGSGISSIAVNQVTDKIYVAGRLYSDVTIIDGATNSTVAVAAGKYPRWIAVNSATNKIYVTDGFFPNGLTIIDGTSDATTFVQPGQGEIACGMAIDETANKIYIPSIDSDLIFRLTEIDGASNSYATINFNHEQCHLLGHPIGVDSQTNEVYVSNYTGNTVVVVNGISFPLVIENGATFVPGILASASIASIFGEGLANSAGPATPALPPTELNGASVSVQDSAGTLRAAPLFYASPTQVNFEVPEGTASGNAMVTVTSGSTSYTTSAQIAGVAPGVFSLNTSGLCAAEAVLVHTDGTQNQGAVYQKNAYGNVVPLPIAFGVSTDQLYLAIYGTGFRHGSVFKAVVGASEIPLIFAGEQGSFVSVR